MFFLFLATLCSASIALIFKYSEGTGCNRYVVTTANYLVAFITSAYLIWSKSLLSEINFSFEGFLEIPRVLTENNQMLTPLGSATWALCLGIFAGVFFFLSFVFYQKSVKENGAGISGTFAKLGILIPMIFSILFWREIPTLLQWSGILLALTSILVVNYTKKSWSVNITLILLFLLGGFAEFTNKIYQQYALNDFKDIFLFFVFFTAFWISLIYTKRKKTSFQKKDVLVGFCVGVPNLFSSYFLIMSLDALKTSVVFPIYSAGSIVLIALGGKFLFREQMRNKEKLAIVLTVIALILINL